MGLDMYLRGKKYHWRDFGNPQNDKKEDGYRVHDTILEIGYWRKHPDLHGYIVQNFAGGVDECQEIELSEENIEDILAAVKDEKLPLTTGFFFGKSLPEDKEPTIKILEKALEWLRTKEPLRSRYICYRASW